VGKSSEATGDVRFSLNVEAPFSQAVIIPPSTASQNLEILENAARADHSTPWRSDSSHNRTLPRRGVVENFNSLLESSFHLSTHLFLLVDAQFGEMNLSHPATVRAGHLGFVALDLQRLARLG
jgi:hypothetical protein